MAKVEVSNITSTGFDVRLIELDKTYEYKRKVDWVIYNLSSGGLSVDHATEYISPFKEYGGDYTVTGLSKNTKYQATCRVCGIVNGTEVYLNSFASAPFYTKGDSGGGSSGGGTDEPDGWYLTETNLGTLDGDCSRDFYLGAYQVRRFQVKFAESGTVKFYTTGSVDTLGILTTYPTFDEGFGEPEDQDEWLVYNSDALDGTNFYFEYDVKVNTPYYVWVRGYDWNGEDYGDVVLHIDVPYDSTSVEKWDWYSSNGTASVEQTKSAYKAITKVSGYTVNNFSHKVWNDMVEKVHEIRCAKNMNDWDDNYATKEKTKMTASKQTLTAVMFNSLRNNLELVGLNLGLSKITDGCTKGCIPHPVYSKDDKTVEIELQTVYGHYFTTLTDYMNDCIDML